MIFLVKNRRKIIYIFSLLSQLSTVNASFKSSEYGTLHWKTDGDAPWLATTIPVNFDSTDNSGCGTTLGGAVGFIRSVWHLFFNHGNAHLGAQLDLLRVLNHSKHNCPLVN